VTGIEGGAVENAAFAGLPGKSTSRWDWKGWDLQSSRVQESLTRSSWKGVVVMEKEQEDLWRWAVLFYWVDNLDGQVDRYQVNGSEL
jgi:hypothetical protein